MLKNIDVKFTSHYTLPVNSKNIFMYPFIAKRITKYVNNNNINIVHVRSRGPAWISSLLSTDNIKTVSTFHNIYGGDNLIKKFYNKRMAKVNYIIAISDYVKQEISNKYNINLDRIFVINRGVDTDFFEDDVSENEKKIFLDKYNIASSQKIFLYPGRITEWKGQYKFISEIEKINMKGRVIVFAGDSSNISHTNQLKKEIKNKNLTDKCKILGSLDDQDLKIAYSLSDLVLSLPTRPEGFGRTISETISMKKIILAKNIGGVFDQLKDLDKIYKIEERDMDQLSEKIEQIMQLQEDFKENLVNKGRDHVRNNFSLHNMVSNYFNFYEKISI
jgi:glycosyltransferase involved in cell wall biosynthesis